MLSYDQVRAKVASNNKALPAFSNEVIVCQIWKESSFDEIAQNGAHLGLMQVSSQAVDYVNANTPPGVHFNYPADLLDADKNIQCGTYYLSIWMAKNSTSVADTLNAFGTGPGYADNILQCQQCLVSGSASQGCLNAIHP
jgi:hypothetical protein